jgi:AcrR family transcriptional regulator/predicted DNA-binding transcriptional regulator AlpA
MTKVMTSSDKADKEMMKMSQLAAASGLTVSTIKFYMSQGLLPRPRKSKPNVAFYDEAFLRRLLVIKSMRDENLSVSSIKSILDKYPFEQVDDWEAFKENAKTKDADDLVEEERLATLSGEERRTDAILDAAYSVFSTKGYHNSTVDDIAQQAGVSKGTCYQYFSGKEEIFIATLDRTLGKILAEAEGAAAGATDALTRMGLKGLTFIAKFRELQFMFIGQRQAQDQDRVAFRHDREVPCRGHRAWHQAEGLQDGGPDGGRLRDDRHRRRGREPLPDRGRLRRPPLLHEPDGFYAARPRRGVGAVHSPLFCRLFSHVRDGALSVSLPEIAPLKKKT